MIGRISHRLAPGSVHFETCFSTTPHTLLGLWSKCILWINLRPCMLGHGTGGVDTWMVGPFLDSIPTQKWLAVTQLFWKWVWDIVSFQETMCETQETQTKPNSSSSQLDAQNSHGHSNITQHEGKFDRENGMGRDSGLNWLWLKNLNFCKFYKAIWLSKQAARAFKGLGRGPGKGECWSLSSIKFMGNTCLAPCLEPLQSERPVYITLKSTD